MAISNIAMKAYANALDVGNKIEQQRGSRNNALHKQEKGQSFSDLITESIENVNQMQAEKGKAIEAFVSGENQNVHELMITLQKAGITMSMTNAVRSKVMESYKELMSMSF